LWRKQKLSAAFGGIVIAAAVAAFNVARCPLPVAVSVACKDATYQLSGSL